MPRPMCKRVPSFLHSAVVGCLLAVRPTAQDFAAGFEAMPQLMASLFVAPTKLKA